MEISVDTIVTFLSLLIGGGSLGGVFVWRYTKRKAAAEAKTAEVDMAQKVQDTYQQMLDDKNKEVDDNHRLIEELRQDRDRYKKDRDELQGQLSKLSADIQEWKKKSNEEMIELRRMQARQGRQLEAVRPFICSDLTCKKRMRGIISDAGDIDNKDVVSPNQEKSDIEPINNNDL